MSRTSPAAQKKIANVMHEFADGTLKSSSGQKVTNKKQALAIGYSEARESKLKVPEKSTSAKTSEKGRSSKKSQSRQKHKPS